MGRKRTPGLYQRNGIWHIDKSIHGRRICQSTEAASLEEAERFVARLAETIRQASIYGVRPTRTFEQAAAKYVLENEHKRSLASDIGRLKLLMPRIGQMPLDRLHRGSLQPWIEERQRQGAAAGTINHGLKVVRHLLNLAANEWVDEHGLTWLAGAPKIKLLPDTEKRQPYPLSWDEQARLFKELAAHLASMALFAVSFVDKNGDERLVVLNRIAKSVVDAQRGQHATHVFTYKGKPTTRMLNKAWLRAREAAGLRQVRVHDLKHTFGRRLRAAGVSFEDRQDLLGHRSARITTHYSAAELSKLIEAANRICESGERRPELVVLRRRFGT